MKIFLKGNVKITRESKSSLSSLRSYLPFTLNVYLNVFTYCTYWWGHCFLHSVLLFAYQMSVVLIITRVYPLMVVCTISLYWSDVWVWLAIIKAVLKHIKLSFGVVQVLASGCFWTVYELVQWKNVFGCGSSHGHVPAFLLILLLDTDLLSFVILCAQLSIHFWIPLIITNYHVVLNIP